MTNVRSAENAEKTTEMKPLVVASGVSKSELVVSRVARISFAMLCVRGAFENGAESLHLATMF